jgi:hypothetical protein
MLFFGGLFAGCALIFAVERVWSWKAMGIGDFAADFSRAMPRFDPFIPLLGVASLAGAIAFAASADGAASTLAAVAATGVVVVMIGSVALMEPINSQFRRSPEGAIPDQAERLRARWRRLHVVRATLIVCSFAAMVAAAVVT